MVNVGLSSRLQEPVAEKIANLDLDLSLLITLANLKPSQFQAISAVNYTF